MDKQSVKTKVLFLDIDGVLNSRRTVTAFGRYPYQVEGKDFHVFDHVALSLIKRLCRETGCDIVISSTWKNTYSWEKIGASLDLPVIGATPSLYNKLRGMEIRSWLDENTWVTRYAIVDDIQEMLPEQQKRFVKTDPDDGFCLRHYNRLLKILGLQKKSSRKKD